MAKIVLNTYIAAPAERCFDLARSIDLHTRSTAATNERAVHGVTRGLIGPGQGVTWRARHLGVRRELTSRITDYDRPRRFRNSQVHGPFRRFDHDHYFTPEGQGTRMTDVFDYTAPLGPLGWLAERMFLTGYLRRVLAERNRVIRSVAESEEWRELLASV